MPSLPLAPPTPLGPAARALGAVARRWPVALLTIAGIAFATPFVLVAHATARARDCLARITAPRGPDLPDCRREMRWFAAPSRIPWTAVVARLRAEELASRAAAAAYDDAAVGRPDAAREARAAEDLALAEHVVRTGSTRLAVEDLGSPVGTADVGRSVMLAGDRRTLLARAETWEHWSVRLRTMEAALLEGDLPRAAAVAKRYAEFTPWDDDLRFAVSAMLCLEGDASRGTELLATMATERAQNRHEAWARNWGDVRALLVACSAKRRAEPPPLPPHGEAGVGDQGAARAVQRLRLASEGDDLREAATSAITLLESAALAPGERLSVLAALLASGHPVDAERAALLATPHLADGEQALLPEPRALTAVDWLDEPRVLRPVPSRQALRHAVDQLRRLSASPELSAEQRRALETAATAAALAAARASALAGEGASAVEILDRAGPQAIPGAAARALARSTAWYVAEEPERALAEVATDPADLPDQPAVRVAWWIQKAELLASAGRRDEAAHAAVLADEAASTDDPRLAPRAAWTRLALAPSSPLRPRPSPALAFWNDARHASPEEKRTLRYAVFADRRGDAPRAVSAYLALAAELLPEGDGDVEVWLDAFAATASRGLTLRAYCWARAEAARFRGDAVAGSRWAASYRTLARRAAEKDDVELAAALGI